MTTKISTLIDILIEYYGVINIKDFNLVVQGCQLAHIYYNVESDKVRYFTVDIEELFPTDEEFNKIYDLVVKNYG